jgi:hypothetical protein
MKHLLLIVFLLAIQLAEPFGVSDYPEAISFGCRSMIAGDSPYAVVCSSGNPISPGAGYLFLFLISGLFLVPQLVPIIGIGIVGAMFHDHPRYKVLMATLLLISLRATIHGMDYLFAGGALCWLLLLA